MNDNLIDIAFRHISDEIDSEIMFNLFTKKWHKMEITFDNTRYSEHPAMEQWCHENIGPGGWTWGRPSTWEGLGDKIWIMHSTFGNTTFAFKDPRHYTLFVLRWS